MGTLRIREFYERFRRLIHEAARFLVVGAAGVIVTFGISDALYHHVGQIAAVTVATILANVVTFLGNGLWAFRGRKGRRAGRGAAAFIVLSGIGLLIYYLTIWVFQDAAGLRGGLWYNLELLIGMALGTLFRFWSYRRWVWRAPDAPVLPPRAAQPADAPQVSAAVSIVPGPEPAAAGGSDAGRAPEP